MRTYARKTEARPLTEALLNEARLLIERGFSIRQSAKEIGFDESTVRKRLKKGSGASQLGRFRRVFSQEQEHEIVDHCKALDRRFYGLTLKSLRLLLSTYAERNEIQHPFNKQSNTAGRDFTRNFMKRHHLALRTPRKTSVARTMAFNKIQITTYFNNLQELFDKYQFPPNRLFNMDETGIQTVPNKLPKHIAPKGKREVGKSVSAEQGQTVTAVCCMSATGQFVPPFFIFKRKRMNLLLIKDGPAGCAMAVTEKGYMNTPTFIQWLKHFESNTQPSEESPVLLVLDNHVSHVSYEAITYAKSKYIHMLSLPPHTSHKTQPLDRIFFRPLKAHFDTAVDDWTTSHPGQVVTTYHIAELFKVAYERTATIEKASQGFRATGIFPLNKNIFSDDDFLPSEVTDQDLYNEDLDEDERAMVVFSENHGPSDESGPLSPSGASGSAEPGAASQPEPVDQPGAASQPKLLGKSPKDIVPLPKIGTKRKRTRRSLKSTLLTSSPNKERLEAMQAEKSKVKANAKRVLFKKTVPKMSKEDTDSSDVESDFSLHESSEDSNFVDSDSDLEVPAPTASGDFLLVRVFDLHKKSFRMYVARILTIVTDGFMVVFYKRVPKTMRFTETEETSFLGKNDIVKKLSKAIASSSARFQQMVAFSDDLSYYSVY